MILYVIIASLVAVGAGWAAWRFRKKAIAERKRADKLAKEVNRRGHIIKRMEEIWNETAKKKKKLRVGSDSDKFDASLAIMSELADRGRADPD